VELAPGRFAKMHKQDAIEAGLFQAKKREPQEDKMRRPAEDKAEGKGAEEQGSGGAKETAAQGLAELERAEDVDDFTVIPGVGPSTAENLWLLGFRRLEELRSPSADLNELDARARRAIERWRDG
jgi:predicted flap endonuclease-1-like 5' DNA nuclease